VFPLLLELGPEASAAEQQQQAQSQGNGGGSNARLSVRVRIQPMLDDGVEAVSAAAAETEDLRIDLAHMVEFKELKRPLPAAALSASAGDSKRGQSAAPQQQQQQPQQQPASFMSAPLAFEPPAALLRPAAQPARAPAPHQRTLEPALLVTIQRGVRLRLPDADQDDTGLALTASAERKRERPSAFVDFGYVPQQMESEEEAGNEAAGLAAIGSPETVDTTPLCPRTANPEWRYSRVLPLPPPSAAALTSAHGRELWWQQVARGGLQLTVLHRPPLASSSSAAASSSRQRQPDVLIGRATVPLRELAAGQEISGRFEILDSEGEVNASSVFLGCRHV
jgi:hypothetical protein